MKKTIYNLLLLGIFGFGITSCDDFLDEVPDGRAEIDNQEKVIRILASAYPAGSYNYMTEMASDNADESVGPWGYETLQREIYEWGKISDVGSDSPHHFWEECYSAIASANVALDAIERLGNLEEMNPQKGEALICRAYAHFMLVNIFSKHYSTTSTTDLGIPYITTLETTVKPKYDRITVAEVYKKIEKDLLDALPLINDGSYEVKKYHFNKAAANAFATRFYLYYRNYDKVIEYADKVLGKGAAAAAEVRDWEAVGQLSANGNLRPNLYIDVDNRATLMNVSAYSAWAVLHGPFIYGTKYTHSDHTNITETNNSVTAWGNLNSGILYDNTFWNDQVNKRIVRKVGYYFRSTDAIAGTGYYYIIQAAFTTDETLMCRAEAYIMKKMYAEATTDLNTFMTAFTSAGAKTETQIADFYNGIAYYTPEAATVKKQLNPDFELEAGKQTNFIHCLLHTRRILTMHEGLRWFDIKRYGIEIHRRQIRSGGITVTDQMPANDLRRVFQLPADVINAGLAANPR